MIANQSDIFRDRLRAARELRGMSQSELATQAKLPASSIAHFESGGRKPSFDNLRRLGIALMVTTDYLLGRVDTPDMATAGDPLHRHIANLSAADRPVAETVLRALAEKNARRSEGESES